MNSVDVFLTEHQRQLVYTNVCKMIHPVPVILGYRVVCLMGKKTEEKADWILCSIERSIAKTIEPP